MIFGILFLPLMRKGIFVAVFLMSLLRVYAMDGLFQPVMFYDPDRGAYIETQMLFYGSSLKYAMLEDSTFQSRVELTYIFKQNDSIIDFSKNAIRGPIIADTQNAIQDFIDVQRFILSPDTYTLEITLKDLNNPTDIKKWHESILVEVPAKEAFFSDLILAESAEKTTKDNKFSRAGYDLLPKLGSYFPPDSKTLHVYTEFYQSDIQLGENEPFLIVSDLLNYESNEPISEFRSIERKTAKDYIPVLKAYSISDLPNGNYVVRIQARDRNNELIDQKLRVIHRLNTLSNIDSLSTDEIERTFVKKFVSKDSLKQMIYCLRPNSESSEERFIDKSLDTASEVTLKRFFYGYWYKRNSLDPESEWMKYHKDVEYVIDEYSTRYHFGCATDRGRVYLEYGKPDGKVNRQSTSIFYPYEMWHYYASRSKPNAKFLFYDQTLGTGQAYTLIHTNRVPGEPVDYNWFYRLQRRGNYPSDVDELGSYDTFGVNPREDWEIPP